MPFRHVLKSRRGAELTAAEQKLLADAVSEVRHFEPRQIIVRQNVPLQFSTLLLEGIMSRHVDDRGGVRQLVAVHFPGDFVDLHAYPLKTLDHEVGSITPIKVAIVPHAQLDWIQDEHPVLARKLWFLTLLDAAMHRKWVFRLGRLKAVQRVAHFLCETNVRLFLIGLSDGQRFGLPLTQFDMGEICGMTSIHVNRVMRELRDRGLCTFRASLVEIHDLVGLAELGEFTMDYLYLTDAMRAKWPGGAG